MNILIMFRNTILAIGWPILIIGSIYLIIKGREVYRLVKGSLVGRVIKILVATMLVEMYSLGIVCTAYMFSAPRGVYVVLPIFTAWFVMFVLTLKILLKAGNEAKALAGGAK